MGKGSGTCSKRTPLSLESTGGDHPGDKVASLTPFQAKELLQKAVKDPSWSNHDIYLLQRRGGYRGWELNSDDYHPALKKLLNGHWNLYDQHTRRDDSGTSVRDENGAPRLTLQRELIHEEIVENAACTATKAERKLLCVLGAPGSGKSSCLSKLDIDCQGWGVVNPDHMIEALPEYSQILATGDPSLSEIVYLEKKALAQSLMNRWTQAGYNIVLDTTGNQGPGSFKSQLERFYQQGYAVQLVYVNTGPSFGF